MLFIHFVFYPKSFIRVFKIRGHICNNMKKQGFYGGIFLMTDLVLFCSRYIFNPRFRSCRMSEKENFSVSLSNFTALSFCTPSGVSIRLTFSGFPL